MATRQAIQSNRLYAICYRLYWAQANWQKHMPKSAKDVRTWEQVCCEVLLLHGRPPPFVSFEPDPDPDVENWRRRMYLDRNRWMMKVGDTLLRRYNLNPRYVAVFIVAYEKWCTQLMEDDLEQEDYRYVESIRKRNAR